MANPYIVSCVFKGCNIYQAVLKIYSQVNKRFWSYVKIEHVFLFMLRYKSLKFYFWDFTFLLTSAPILMNFVYVEGFFPLLRNFFCIWETSTVEKLFHAWETISHLRNFCMLEEIFLFYIQGFQAWETFSCLRGFSKFEGLVFRFHFCVCKCTRLKVWSKNLLGSFLYKRAQVRVH